MSSDDRKRAFKIDVLLAGAMVAAGLAVIGLSAAWLSTSDPHPQMAQATQPLQSTPGAESKPSAPTEPKEPGTTGMRPTEVPPQPARPDAEAQKAGSQPALPPAPAEKSAPPIKER